MGRVGRVEEVVWLSKPIDIFFQCFRASQRGERMQGAPLLQLYPSHTSLQVRVCVAVRRVWVVGVREAVLGRCWGEGREETGCEITYHCVCV